MSVGLRVQRVAVVVAWMALLTYWSSQGNLPIDAPQIAGPLHNLQHRVAHLVAFGLLGLLARWAFDGLPRSWLLAVALVSLFGATDEWHQSFTPGRRAAIDDWALDTASAALALFVWTRVRRRAAVEIRVRALAPALIGVLFTVGVGLAFRSSVQLPQGVSGATLRSVAHTAVDLARETRDAARQIRTTMLG